MTDLQGSRDRDLGEALRRLDVPDHRPGFHAAVAARLEEPEERADLQQPRERRARAHSGRRRRQPLVWRWATAAAVVATAVSVVVMGGPRGTNTVDVVSAAEVRAKVASAWAAADTVTGTLVTANRAGEAGRRRWRFILTARGDVRLTDVTRGADVAYDAGRNVERSLWVSESVGDSEVLFANVRRGLAAGWPDPSPADELLDRNLGSVVRALVAGGSATVQETVYRSRPAWLLDSEIRPNLIVPEASPNRLAVTVDQQTGFPVKVVASHDGRVLWTTTVNNLKVNGPVRKDAFALRFPTGVEVFRSDAGFRVVPVAEVEARVGYAPLLPTDIPEGYELGDVRVSNTPSPTGAEAGNPPMSNIVSAVYRRGLDHFLVTTRPTGPDRARWNDPLASGEGYVDEPESITFSRGALSGERGELLIDPLATPHIWVATPDLVVTVSGDLTRTELLRVAESLERGHD